jgi:hypothetical protein
MKKNIRQRPVRGFWDWVATGDWDGGHANTGTHG